MNRDHEDLDVEVLFSNVKDISSLAHYARCQAQEAEMRANYTINLAERAAFEAEAVRNVAESLTKTARSVAKTSLEHISKMNSAEYRSLKRGQILAAVRNGCDRKCPEHQKRSTTLSPRQPSPKTIKREALSEETVVHTKLTDTNRRSVKDRPEHTDTVTTKEQECPTSAVSQNQGTDFLDNSDLLVCVESLHRQTSQSSSGSQFTETFPDTEEKKSDIVKDFDSTEKLPIVWEDFYQGQAGRRPMPWSDKKSIRKMQRKLRDLEVTEEGKRSRGAEDVAGDPSDGEEEEGAVSNDEYSDT